MAASEEIEALVKDFILRDLLYGESEEALDGAVRLVSDGVLDSIACLRLVFFLEETFQMSISASHVDADHLDTLDVIVRTVLENAF